MTHQEFEAFFSRTVAEIRTLAVRKGADYSPGENRFSHFYDEAGELNLSPEQIWAVFAGKHWRSIRSYTSNPDHPLSEDVISRIHDLIVYLILLAGMVEDSRHPPVAPPDPTPDPVTRLLWED